MTLEAKFEFIDDLNPLYPEQSAKISEAAGPHPRGIKEAVKGSFPNLGQVAVTLTADQLNKAVIADENTEVDGNIIFANESFGLQWKSTAFDPVLGYDITFTAFSMPDPYVAGNPIIGGLSLNCPLVQVNNPPTPGVTSGFQIGFRSDDAAPVSGFEFLDKVDDSQAGGFSVFDDITNIGMVLANNTGGKLYFKDTQTNGGNFVSLGTLFGTQAAVQAVEDVHGPLLAYIEQLEARIAALEAA